MPNITQYNISVACTKHEWKEIVNALQSNQIPWAVTTVSSPMEFYEYFGFSFAVGHSDPIGDGYMAGLSECFPSAIFYCEIEYEGYSSKEKIYFANGEEYGTISQCLKESRKAVSKEIERFFEAVPSGVLHQTETDKNGKIDISGENYFGECNADGFTDIIQIACGNLHTVGLKADGSLVATGSNYSEQCDVNKLGKKAVQISCGRYHTAILFEDGTVAVKGILGKRNDFDTVNVLIEEMGGKVRNVEIPAQTKTDDWKNIKSIKSIYDAVIGFDANGNCFIYGNPGCGLETLEKLFGCTLNLFAAENEAVDPQNLKSVVIYNNPDLVDGRMWNLSENHILTLETAENYQLDTDDLEVQPISNVKNYLSIGGRAFIVKLDDTVEVVNYRKLHKGARAHKTVEKEIVKETGVKKIVSLLSDNETSASLAVIYNDGTAKTFGKTDETVKSFIEKKTASKIVDIFGDISVAVLYENGISLLEYDHSRYAYKKKPIVINKYKKIYQLENGKIVIEKADNDYIVMDINPSPSKITANIVKFAGYGKGGVLALKKGGIPAFFGDAGLLYTPRIPELPMQILKSGKPIKDILCLKWTGWHEELVAILFENGDFYVNNELFGKHIHSVEKCGSKVIAYYADTYSEQAVLDTTQEQPAESDWKIKKEGECCYITGLDVQIRDLIIPAEIKGIRVKGIAAGAFKDFTGLRSVIISEGITYIGRNAFEECKNLSKVVIPNSVTILDDNAFLWCNSITDIQLGDNIKKIGRGAIPSKLYYENDCLDYEKEHVENGVFYLGKYLINVGCENEHIKIKEGTELIASGAFCNCRDLKSVEFPSTLKYIGNRAFNFLVKLEAINIPQGVLSIGKEAFSYCKMLKTVIIPDGVTEIGAQAFEYCEELKTVTVPNSITEIGDEAFHGCQNLESVVLSKNSAEANQGLFEVCESQLSAELSRTPKSIGWRAFAFLDKLETVEIPRGILTIGDQAFCDCAALKTVTVPDSIVKIGKEAFYSCKALKAITIPDSVTEIGKEAFYSCKALKAITIPDSVAKIGEKAFRNCEALKTIVVPNSVKEIDENAFSGCKDLGSVVLSKNLKRISKSLFEKCENLMSVVIPDGVTEIENHVFGRCHHLKSVTIPKSVEEIGCYMLTSVYGDSIDQVAIYGEKGSAAEKFALENDVKFVEI